MSASSKATDQTNQNQAALAQQQQQTQSQLITAQQANDALINKDLGTLNHVPAPSGIPSVSSVTGPSEDALLSSLSVNNLTTAETEAAAQVDPNETGLLATFFNSATTTQAGLSANRADTLEAIKLGQGATQVSLASQNANLTSALLSSSAASQLGMAQAVSGGGQGIANPLGPQVTYVDAGSTTTTTAPAGSGLSPVVLIGVVAIGGGALWFFERHHKKAA